MAGHSATSCTFSSFAACLVKLEACGLCGIGPQSLLSKSASFGCLKVNDRKRMQQSERLSQLYWKPGLGQTANLISSILLCYSSTFKCLEEIVVGHWQGSLPSPHQKYKLVLHLLVLLNWAADWAGAKCEGEDAVVLMMHILQLPGSLAKSGTAATQQVLLGCFFHRSFQVTGIQDLMPGHTKSPACITPCFQDCSIAECAYWRGKRLYKTWLDICPWLKEILSLRRGFQHVIRNTWELHIQSLTCEVLPPLWWPFKQSLSRIWITTAVIFIVPADPNKWELWPPL